MASQSSGSDGLTDDHEGGEGERGHGVSGRDWGVSVEAGVWDEPIIKRWEDAKVSRVW